MKGFTDGGNKVVNGKTAKMKQVFRLEVSQVSSPPGTEGRDRIVSALKPHLHGSLIT